MNWQNERTNTDVARQNALTEINLSPKHIAIIMDGNGRWAIEKGKNRAFGHQAGTESVRDIVKACSQLGIQYLTLYTFSIENWRRPASEVGILMKILEKYLKKEINELHQNNVKFMVIGKISSLPKNIQQLIFDAQEKTKDNKGLKLTLALSYSGRWDIVRAVQMIALDVRRGVVSPEDINEEFFSKHLVTSKLPDPDLLIRTSGEMRLSNFLLWEMAYSEIYITNKLWPDFRRDDLYEALEDYIKRERRFGKTTAQIKVDSNALV